MKDKPTYLRASVEDWKNRLISIERLLTVWEVQFYAAHHALCEEEQRTGKWRDIPTERIEGILEGLIG